MADAPKNCALCGCDCTSRPRIKDAKGRYYCRDCYEEAKQKAAQRDTAAAPPPQPQARPQVRPPRSQEPDPADAMQDLLQAEQTSRSETQHIACPGCGASIGGGVICMNCGYDIRTGKRLAMQMEAPRAGTPAAAGPSVGARAIGGTIQLVKPVIFGAIAGLIGAGVWAGVAYGLDLEIGYVAVGVGALVGFGVAYGGGSSSFHGLMAAGIAVVAICAGKIATIEMSMDAAVQKKASGFLTQAKYNEAIQTADAFARLTGPKDYPQFMIDKGLTEADSPKDVTSEEVSDFQARVAPRLKQLKSNPPSFEEWKKQKVAILTAVVREKVTFGDMLKKTMGVFDVLFFMLAIGAAYRIPAGRGILGGS